MDRMKLVSETFYALFLTIMEATEYTEAQKLKKLYALSKKLREIQSRIEKEK